jgi:hypothetical protein
MLLQETLFAVPAVFEGRLDIDKTSSVILPHSIFSKLISLNAHPPYQFKIHSCEGKFVCATVLDFTADDETVLIPYWMLLHLEINPHDPVRITDIRFPKGNFLKIQPHQMKFIELENPDPKTILETELSKFSCLTKNSTIHINHDDQVYKFNILELKNNNKDCDYISIVDVDLNIDFERPLDKPPTPPPSPKGGFSPFSFLDKKECCGSEKEKEKKFVSFSGTGRTLGSTIQVNKSSLATPEVKPEVKQETKQENKVFTSFSGRGRVLGSNPNSINLDTYEDPAKMFDIGFKLQEIKKEEKKEKKEKK